MSEIKLTGHQKDKEQLLDSMVDEIEIPVPWGHVAARWWGPRSKQPIIALHGWQDNAGTWDNLIPLLPVTTSVLCLDLPGHGLSSHYPKGMLYHTYWDGIILLRRIIKQYNWNKVTLMGHSLGGGVIFMYAASFPEEVDRIICIDTASPAVRDPQNTSRNTGPSIDRLLAYENMPDEKDRTCYDRNLMIDIACDAYNGSVSKKNCIILMKRGMSPAPSHMNQSRFYFKRDPRLKASGIGTMGIDTALAYASKIRCKVLNIRAIPGLKRERLDYYFDVIEKMKENAVVRYEEVKGTHHVHLETPENIVQIIREFLEK